MKDCTNLNKNQYTRLLVESAQLAIKLNRLIDLHRYSGFKMRVVCIKAWRRHWRRVAKFNQIFAENLYVPD